MLQKRHLASLLTMLVLGPLTAKGADIFWLPATGDWSLASNWSLNRLPTNSDNAIVTNGRSTIITASGAVCSRLYLGNDASGGGLQMTGGNLSATEQYIGNLGPGSFTQSDGTNTTSTLLVGYSAVGTYTLSGGFLSASSQLIGRTVNKSSFLQSGGTNSSSNVIYVGVSTGHYGEYTLNGSGRLSAPTLRVGTDSKGTFTQSGGTVTLTRVSQSLYVGSQGGTGTYELGEGWVSATEEFVGFEGTGSFSQTGGIHTTSRDLYLGPGGSGTYSLSGNGVHTVSGNLYLGENSNYQEIGNGIYNLSGEGQLSASAEYLGNGSGVTVRFNQTGGTNTTTYLSIRSGSRYSLSGGALLVNGVGISSQGVFDGGNSPASLSGANCIINFSSGAFVNTGGMSVNMGSNSLIILPTGFNVATAFAGYSSLGVTHVSGSTLLVPADKGFVGSATINDHVDCQGTITAVPGRSINLNKGLMLSGAGQVQLGTDGTLTVKNALSGISGGILTCKNQYVGYSGDGAFSHSGGSNTMSYGLYLGYNAGDSGTYSLSGTARLSSALQWVGYSGNGTVFQTGGTNSVAVNNSLYLGYNAGSNGMYDLSGGLLSADAEVVGYSGVGSFTQSGGTHTLKSRLTLGNNPGVNGTYTLNGGQLSAGGEAIGYQGFGSFVQSGGTNTVVGNTSGQGELSLGSYAATSGGTYTLSGFAVLSARSEYIGNVGTGTFVQNGGTNSSPIVQLGHGAQSTGTYTLSGDGVLSVAGSVQVGYSGAGLFRQSGGTASITGTDSYGGLFVGSSSVNAGRYELSGSALLSAVKEYVARDSGTTGFFIQSGGTNTATSLAIGTGGQYQLKGGMLQINAGIINKGVFAGGDNAATLSGANCIIDLSNGIWGNLRAVSMAMGNNSLVLFPPGFDISTELAGYASTGLTHFAGSPLVVPSGTLVSGVGSIADQVDCRGDITAATGAAINLSNGLILSNAGTVTLGSGNLIVNDATSGLISGSLTAESQIVGNLGAGVFTHSGGTANCYTLTLGNNGTDSGTYNLSGNGRLSVKYEYVGSTGTGVFSQSGGSNTASDSGNLMLGYLRGSSGTYTLSGAGQLTVTGNESVGDHGEGHFEQLGGTNTVSNGLALGRYAGANGTYSLKNGRLSVVGNVFVGGEGIGFFSQSGGINSLDFLALGDKSGSAGTYELSGASQLSAGSESIGNYGGTGTFTQSGGTNTVTTLYVSGSDGGGGTYSLNGGLLRVSSIVKRLGPTSFNFGGGTLKATGTLSCSVPMTLTGTGGNANVDTNNFTVTLSGGLSGPGGLNKLGAGKLTLGGANTYNGPTTITTGTLSLAGGATLSNSSVIDVAANTLFDVSALSGGFTLAAEHTLKGTGKVLGNLIVEGTHAPGASPGITFVQGNYTLLGDLEIDVHGVFAGSGYDAIYQLGGVGPYSTTLAGTLSLDWTGFSGSSDTTKIWILRNLTQGTLSGTFSNYWNGAWLGNHDGRDWYLWCGADFATGNLTGGRDVLISTVPEPSTLALLAGALAVWAFARRRRTPAD